MRVQFRLEALCLFGTLLNLGACDGTASHDDDDVLSDADVERQLSQLNLAHAGNEKAGGKATRFKFTLAADPLVTRT